MGSRGVIPKFPTSHSEVLQLPLVRLSTDVQARVAFVAASRSIHFDFFEPLLMYSSRVTMPSLFTSNLSKRLFAPSGSDWCVV